MEGILLIDLGRIKEAFDALVGISGDKYVGEICDNGYLSHDSYLVICGDSSHKAKELIIEHFGIVQYCYLQGLTQSAELAG